MIHASAEDSSYIHRSHDVDMKLGPTALSSQPLAVPPPNAAALVTRRDGFLTEPGGSFPTGSEVTLFNSEVDRYRC